MAVSTVSALMGAVRHIREGRVDMRVALVMGAPSMLGAFLGGLNSQRAPETLLVFGVGVLVIWQGLELMRRTGGRRMIGVDAGEDAPDALSDGLTTLSRKRLLPEEASVSQWAF